MLEQKTVIQLLGRIVFIIFIYSKNKTKKKFFCKFCSFIQLHGTGRQSALYPLIPFVIYWSLFRLGWLKIARYFSTLCDKATITQNKIFCWNVRYMNDDYKPVTHL